jgi:GntR family transcriptional regulator/MocR family aminotransferase
MGKASSSTSRVAPSRAAALTLALDPEAPRTLQRQLYDALCATILDGRLAPGECLPGTRSLAASLEVSRTTVALVFDQLRAEGYVNGRPRSGTFVAHVLPDTHLHAVAGARAGSAGAGQPARSSRGRSAKRAVTSGTRAGDTPGGLSRRGRVIASLTVGTTPLVGATGSRAFRMGTPALDHFPLQLWGRLLSRRWRGVAAAQLAYAEPHGYAPLRAAIAAYVRQARAVSCDPEQVIVVSGAQQAFDLAARVLLDPGDAVAMEDPGYRGARAAVRGADGVVVPVPVDANGIDVDALRALAPAPRMACVTPSHQFPLGVTLSAARRLALLDWARLHGAWIVEDDFDSEYRFRGRPLPSLQGMDPDGRVIYVGTFSKTLFPALRLGYVIVPPSLVDAFARARAVVDRHPSSLEQAVLAEFIAEGHFARHVRRMRALYATRQATLLQLLGGDAAEWMRAEPVDAGMHLVAWLRPGLDDSRLSARALEEGVVTSPLSALSISAPARGLPTRGALTGVTLRRGALRRGALMLGVAAFDRDVMARALATLCAVARRFPIDNRKSPGQVVGVSASSLLP